MHREQFDSMIGRLDRILSEMICAASEPIDDIDRQTLKHHAEDMLGAGQKVLDILTAQAGRGMAGDTVEHFAHLMPWDGAEQIKTPEEFKQALTGDANANQRTKLCDVFRSGWKINETDDTVEMQYEAHEILYSDAVKILREGLKYINDNQWLFVKFGLNHSRQVQGRKSDYYPVDSTLLSRLQEQFLNLELRPVSENEIIAEGKHLDYDGARNVLQALENAAGNQVKFRVYYGTENKFVPSVKVQ